MIIIVKVKVTMVVKVMTRSGITSGIFGFLRLKDSKLRLKERGTSTMPRANLVPKISHR